MFGNINSTTYKNSKIQQNYFKNLYIIYNISVSHFKTTTTSSTNYRQVTRYCYYANCCFSKFIAYLAKKYNCKKYILMHAQHVQARSI